MFVNNSVDSFSRLFKKKKKNRSKQFLFYDSVTHSFDTLIKQEFYKTKIFGKLNLQ